MRSNRLKLLMLAGTACIAAVALVLTSNFFADRYAGAGGFGVEAPTASSNSTEGNQIYIDSLERLRSEYAAVKTVEMEADVSIDILKTDFMLSGTGHVRFVAHDNKYKYVCSVSENLENEGLMRNVDILFDGEKFYFYDRESKIVSYQSSEEVRLPSALPNPFFLPLDFLSSDDDGCDGCKMRLQDLKQPVRWPKRVNSISQLTSETHNGILHNVIKMSGGTLNQMPYDYRIRLVGESAATMQPIAVSRVKENGLPLAEILLSDFRVAPGMTIKIPYTLELGSRDDSGRLALKAVFTITSLKVNQPLPNSSLSPVFTGAEKIWDSDSRAFTPQ